MAFMCADSGNLTAIARQVIQQQQQQQQQQQRQHLLMVQEKQHLYGQHHQQVNDPYYFDVDDITLPPPWAAVAPEAEEIQNAAPLYYSDSLPASSSAFTDFAPPPLPSPSRAEFEVYQWVDSLPDPPDVAGEAWYPAGSSGSDLADIFSSCLSSSDDFYRALIPDPASSTKADAAVLSVDRNESPSRRSPVRQEAWSVLPTGSPPLHQSPDPSDDAMVSASKSWHPLLWSLVDCACLVDSEPDLAAKSLIRVMDSASAELSQPAERVAYYVSRALYRRLTAATNFCSSPPSVLQPNLPLLDVSSGAWPNDYALHYRAFYDACPYAKFAHLTANQAILEATDSAAHVHIVDFGITHGVQWAAMLQDLATRPSGKPATVRISAVPAPGFSQSALAETGARLCDFAAGLGLDLQFNPVLAHPLQLTASSFCVEPGETVAVNMMLQLGGLLGNAPSPAGVERMLRLAKSLLPKVVTLGENELSLAGGVPRRMGATVGFYTALFESLEAGLPRDSPERSGIERTVLGPELAVVVEGKHRTADMAEWRSVMECCGFQALVPSSYAISQAKLLVWNYNYSSRYSVAESPPAFLSLTWDDSPMLTVSSWR